MAVTKQVYTATATWTAAQLATIFESAFVDSGLMSAWHDSFLSGSVENRVLEITYDGAKTYGKCYYWFQFTTGGVFLAISTGWNTGSDIPAGPSGAGTQYLDWVSTTTNSTANHSNVMAMAATTSTTLTRYTSGVNSAHSWYLLRHSASSFVFRITRGAETRASWLDLDKMHFHHIVQPSTAVDNSAGNVSFRARLGLRRSFWAGAALRGTSSAVGHTSYLLMVAGYGMPGNQSNSANNYQTLIAPNGLTTLACPVILPIAFNNTNTAYSTDQIPIFTGLPYSSYLSTVLPADIGIAAHYANNTMVVGDRLIVTAGVEEWEILAVTNNSTITTGASPMFLARVT